MEKQKTKKNNVKTTRLQIVVSNLMRNYEINYKDVKRLCVASETILDHSKSIKSYLMQLFHDSGNTDIEGKNVFFLCVFLHFVCLRCVVFVNNPPPPQKKKKKKTMIILKLHFDCLKVLTYYMHVTQGPKQYLTVLHILKVVHTMEDMLW